MWFHFLRTSQFFSKKKIFADRGAFLLEARHTLSIECTSSHVPSLEIQREIQAVATKQIRFPLDRLLFAVS